MDAEHPRATGVQRQRLLEEKLAEVTAAQAAAGGRGGGRRGKRRRAVDSDVDTDKDIKEECEELPPRPAQCRGKPTSPRCLREVLLGPRWSPERLLEAGPPASGGGSAQEIHLDLPQANGRATKPLHSRVPKTTPAQRVGAVPALLPGVMAATSGRSANAVRQFWGPTCSGAVAGGRYCPVVEVVPSNCPLLKTVPLRMDNSDGSRRSSSEKPPCDAVRIEIPVQQVESRIAMPGRSDSAGLTVPGGSGTGLSGTATAVPVSASMHGAEVDCVHAGGVSVPAVVAGSTDLGPPHTADTGAVGRGQRPRDGGITAAAVTMACEDVAACEHSVTDITAGQQAAQAAPVPEPSARRAPVPGDDTEIAQEGEEGTGHDRPAHEGHSGTLCVPACGICGCKEGVSPPAAGATDTHCPRCRMMLETLTRDRVTPDTLHAAFQLLRSEGRGEDDLAVMHAAVHRVSNGPTGQSPARAAEEGVLEVTPAVSASPGVPLSPAARASPPAPLSSADEASVRAQAPLACGVDPDAGAGPAAARLGTCSGEDGGSRTQQAPYASDHLGADPVADRSRSAGSADACDAAAGAAGELEPAVARCEAAWCALSAARCPVPCRFIPCVEILTSVECALPSCILCCCVLGHLHRCHTLEAPMPNCHQSAAKGTLHARGVTAGFSDLQLLCAA